jgi:hypothetical protein
MAKDSNESEISLLTKCYPYGTLPPEVDGEGNIEYKVKKNIFTTKGILFLN